MSNRKIAVALLVGAAVITLTLIALVNSPGPITIDTEEEGARIFFSADRRFVNNYGECVNVRWETENIRTIYLNNSPTVGSGTNSICITVNNVPTLDVTFQNDSARSYKLGIGLILAYPLVWLLAFMSALLWVIGGYLLLARFVTTSAAFILRRAGRGVLLFAVGLLATLLMLELGLRFYFGRFGSEQDRVLYVYSAEEIQQKAGRFIGLPYVGYGPSPYYEEHNAFGYRGPDFAIPKPAGVFRIVTLGASTTYGFGVQPSESYPAQLEKILRETYGLANVEVINGGVMGYTSWEILSNLAFRALEVQPDLIIFYEATNDVEVRAKSPSCYHQISPLLGLNTFHGLWKTHFDDISPSTLYRFVGINLGWMPNPGALDFAFAPPVVERDCLEAQPVSAEEAIAPNPPVYYERNLRSMIALAQANGIEVMLSRFIYPTSDLVSFAYPEYWTQAVEEHNEIAARLAEETGAMYYNLAADFEYKPEYWWSAVHLTAAGSALQAQLYAQFIVQNNLIPAN